MKVLIEDIKVNELKIQQIDEYIKFIKYVKLHMEHSEWLGEFSKEDLENLIKNNSKIYIWMYNEEIIASGAIIPSRQKDLDKFFSSELNYKEVVDFGPEAVHPNFVGNGLQKIVISYLELISKKLGYKYAISTIAPDNTFSIRNFEKCNFTKLGEVELKRGNRAVYRKQL